MAPNGKTATRFLIRVKHVTALPDRLPRAGFGAAAPPLRLTRLFEAPPEPPALGGMAATAERRSWLLAEPETDTDQHPWDVAHRMLSGGFGLAGAAPDLIEPDQRQYWNHAPPEDAMGPGTTMPPSCAEAAAQKGTPFVPGPNGRFAWHLEDAYSGLASARALAAQATGRPIRIVHLDTGFDPAHVARPFDISLNEMRNFVDADRPNDATDRTPPGLLKNPGHGTGTLGILAGRRLPAGVIPASSKDALLGGAANEQVIPVRIADSVVHFWTSSVARGIAYAVQIKADVVSMSMGGLPAASWADAVNAAYEAGIVVVCAAGNNFGGAPTSLIVYPARFGRVIAACGVMANGEPYYGLPGVVMQGNAGPQGKMRTALAAHTPNIPWARLGCSSTIDLDGAGTSSATPQIAAAAALWLRRNGARFPDRNWQRAEAVRQALFRSARHAGDEPNPQLGRGVLDARAALDITDPEVKRMPPDSASFAFLRLLTGAFGIAGPDHRLRMLSQEMTQLALRSAAAQAALPDPDLPASEVTKAQRDAFLAALHDDRNASHILRHTLAERLKRTTGTVTLPQAAPVEPLAPPLPTSGGELPRRMLAPPPPARRLRIYATDPGDSRRLATTFVNAATVEVPWEAGSPTEGGTSTLRPGPVGEYLEVVDVDPASQRFYPPVDLNDPLLLAQDGLPPSEGNPQFHQQMVYAVAMRTVRAFEAALGRRALWAPRRVQDPDPENERKTRTNEYFVRRLRIYPHALRALNAYYSPEKVALLFGYNSKFTAAGGAGMVFSCLSHDVIAHETTHALLDGLHRRYQEPTNPDVHAFHEAFADIVAMFQHFTFPELLRFELGRVRGNLVQESMLADLAREFGSAAGHSRALRSALRLRGTGNDYAEARSDADEHKLGSVLVSAVFDAFLAIYARRSGDLMRLATASSGALPPGALPSELVDRLADEASKAARHVLTICIRALDYMPPVDPSFGDYLRALITADSDLVADDRFGYRVAFLEAFAMRGIYASGVKTSSIESLRWQTPAPEAQPPGLGDFIRRKIDLSWDLRAGREESWKAAKVNASRLHEELEKLDKDQARLIGLDFSEHNGKPLPFEVHSVRPARRATPDGDIHTDIIAVITQKLSEPNDSVEPPFRGGCTLVLDRREGMDPIRYCIAKPLFSAARRDAVQQYQRRNAAFGLRSLYFGAPGKPGTERFAMLHEHD